MFVWVASYYSYYEQHKCDILNDKERSRWSVYVPNQVEGTSYKPSKGACYCQNFSSMSFGAEIFGTAESAQSLLTMYLPK